MTTTAQRITIFLAAGFFALLYFGFDIKPESQRLVEKQRSLQATSTDASALLEQARKSLSAEQISVIAEIKQQMESFGTEEEKLDSYKKLSGKWFEFGNLALAGNYAEQAAEIEKSADSWAIAGTTFSLCIQRQPEEKIKEFCTQHAIEAFEKAASLNPEDLRHRVNLALVYADNPPKDNPMKGILMLLELNSKYPDNAMILTQLGRLAIKTGQFEKAVERLLAAIAVEPENSNANCLLAQAYKTLGQKEAADHFDSICKQLSSK